MGALDDAIREHLELKRRQGASEEELKRKEDEAFGRAQLGSTGAPQVTTPDAPEARVPEPVPDADPSEPFEAAIDAASPEPPLPAPEDVELAEERSLAETEIEPDEVLPEEALEPERENGVLTDDVLEEPEILEETPDFLDEDPAEQDRLWFERKPPKDFDFDS
jgi:hypothetical protein